MRIDVAVRRGTVGADFRQPRTSPVTNSVSHRPFGSWNRRRTRQLRAKRRRLLAGALPRIPRARNPGGTVRCVDCRTEPLTDGHYCECCGRKLSLEERNCADCAESAATPAPQEPITKANHCDSCGAPCTEGSLCRTCQHAYGALLNGPGHTASAVPA